MDHSILSSQLAQLSYTHSMSSDLTPNENKALNIKYICKWISYGKINKQTKKTTQCKFKKVSFLLRLVGVSLVFIAGRQNNVGFCGATSTIDFLPDLGELFSFSPRDLQRVFSK